MNIEELGSWGDFIGGIAVVAGLIFVGIQLLGASRETRAATVRGTLEMQALVDIELAKYATTWDKAIRNLPFDSEAEQRRAIILFNLIITVMENRYHQYQAGFLDDKSWAAARVSLQRSLGQNVREDWRKSIGASTHSADFLELIDRIIEEEL